MNETPPLLYVFIGLAVIGFWLGWFLVTKHIRDELRQWREEQRQQHRAVVALLKKEGHKELLDVLTKDHPE